ncbi:hypothetical protein DPEC_G00174120, partial [Dallia pectoralis]
DWEIPDVLKCLENTWAFWEKSLPAVYKRERIPISFHFFTSAPSGCYWLFHYISAFTSDNYIIMAFAPKACRIFLVFLFGVCLQLRAQHIPGARCQCPETMLRTGGIVVDFKIIESTFYCNKTEVIVTIEENAAQRCLNPEGKRGRHFIQCWEKINKNEKLKKSCFRRKP